MHENSGNLYGTDIIFVIGDWVYFKLHPYRQLYLNTITFNKLHSIYFVPYQRVA